MAGTFGPRPLKILAFLCLVLAGLLPAQLPQSINDFKLIARNTGWVVAGNNLLWTKSAGSSWSNITPSVSMGGPIHGVFFLNATSGWVLLTRPGTNATPAGQLLLLKSSDSGRSWSTTSFQLDAEDLAAFAGKADIFFADPMHGWIMLRVASSSNFKLGLLFMTSNGGATWTKLPRPPIGEPVYFVTATDGWVAGGPSGDALFVTRDGGYTWSKQQVPAPPSLGQSSSVTCALPRFATMNDGLIQATFATDDQVFTALYESHDRGATWNFVQAHQSSAPEKDRPPLISALLNSGLIILSGSKMGALVVVGASRAPTHKVGAIAALPEGNVTGISFVDDKTGWLLLSSGRCAGFKTGCSQDNRLLVTRNGARSFSDVTPKPAVLGPPGRRNLR